MIMSSKSYYRVNEFQQDVLSGRDVVLSRGYEIGFYSAMRYINLKKGSTSYLYAAPFAGKSAFMYDIYMYIAKRYGIKIAIYSPEAGDRTALTTHLVQVYLGKKLHGEYAQQATDDEWIEALDFIDNHFVILDPKMVGKDKKIFSAEECFKQVYAAQVEYGWKIDILLLDPYNMLSRRPEDRRMSVADYTLENLTYINAVAQEMDMHIQIAMHLRDQETITDKETGIEYVPRPFPNAVAGGQSVWRVGRLMMGMWRCPAGVIEKDTGMPYPDNSTDFLVQKNKVLGAGETGVFRLMYDIQKQRFYEIVNMKRYYCGEYEMEMRGLIGGQEKPKKPMRVNEEPEELLF